MSKKSTLLLGVFFLSCFLLNFPLLGIFRKMHWWGKIPALYGYIFFVWFSLIFGVWLIVEGDDLPRKTRFSFKKKAESELRNTEK